MQELFTLPAVSRAVVPAHLSDVGRLIADAAMFTQERIVDVFRDARK